MVWEVEASRFTARFLSLPHVRSASVVIGAPKANTTQADITEGGSVFYCPWSRTQSDCHTIEFDVEGEFDGEKLVLCLVHWSQTVGARTLTECCSDCGASYSQQPPTISGKLDGGLVC